ncbi:MAG: CDGSH iron-sulfur domain-containing protein [Actinobacteria bacterium]|nr:CDGSH iron-sulfur domain-containing protein [Actinomycetota bacterium]
MKPNQKVIITKNGPYLVSGKLPLSKVISIVGSSNEPEKWKKGKKYPGQENYALCRCGKSQNKPYCDGTHIKIGFNGEETASKKRYENQAEIIQGPKLDLSDAKKFCSNARFCQLSGGTWHNVKKSDDLDARKIAIKTACNCPSGRLVVWDKKTKKRFEKKFQPSIELIEDPQLKVSGPIWLKGGIEPESADGTKYEKRNRMTLCRCGKSNNKPFCDGSHISVKFNDEDKNLI